MAVESYLSAQKVTLPQNGSDFGGNTLALDCAYELGSQSSHNPGLSLLYTLIQRVMHSLVSRTNTKNIYFL